MADSKIEWTEKVWNPVTGCSKLSSGCRNCYAERIATQMVKRFGLGNGSYPLGFDLQLRPERLDQPTAWKKPRRVFVGSMTDLFQAGVGDAYLDQVFDVMEEHHRHTYLILSKRTGRMASYLAKRWPLPPPNIWVGTSVENQMAARRAEVLATAPAAVRFLSIEPLLGPIEDLHLEGIHWVIVGGESGPKNRIRQMPKRWVDLIHHQALAAGLPFFFKQWGGHRKCECHEAWGCRLYGGRTWDQAPTDRPTQLTLG